MKERVVVGMSGGVDSAVTAMLLKDQGYDVIGVFMNNWEEEGEDGVCTAEGDWRDVRAICDHLDIPYYSVNFARDYWDRVFTVFLDAYRRGYTPNPDVLCNREIKFNAFLDFAMKLGASSMATGHFVRRDETGHLLKGVDGNKDQSYFLYMVKDFQLRHALFPLGGMTKVQVRALAEERGIPVSRKKDSTGVCFIGERNFRTFLAQYLPAQPGDMVSVDGEVLGVHQGLMYYTLGQRKGLGIGGRGDGRSWFVVEKDLARNHLVLAQGEDHPLLYASGCVCGEVTWVAEPPAAEGIPFRCMGKFRYRQNDQPLEVTWQRDRLFVRALVPQRAVTPGQSLVLYQEDRCLGGGIIQEVKRA